MYFQCRKFCHLKIIKNYLSLCWEQKRIYFVESKEEGGLLPFDRYIFQESVKTMMADGTIKGTIIRINVVRGTAIRINVVKSKAPLTRAPLSQAAGNDDRRQ